MSALLHSSIPLAPLLSCPFARTGYSPSHFQVERAGSEDVSMDRKTDDEREEVLCITGCVEKARHGSGTMGRPTDRVKTQSACKER